MLASVCSVPGTYNGCQKMTYQMSVLHGKAAVATHRKQKHGVISLKPDKKTHSTTLHPL